MKKNNPTFFHACLLTLGLVFAQSAIAGYVTDEKSRCQAWAPTSLDTQDYYLRYQGECHGGRAEGKGKAEWMYKYVEGRVAYTWEGRFRNGIFIGDQPVIGKVWENTGVSNSFFVDMGKSKGVRTVYTSTSEQTSPVTLCNVEHIALETDSSIKPEEDVRVQETLRDAGLQYKKTCPKQTNRTFVIAAYSSPIEKYQTGNYDKAYANVRFDPSGQGNAAFSFYENKVIKNIDQQKHKQALNEKKASSREHLIKFSRDNNVYAWVTSNNVDKNPFPWQKKTVAMVVRLDRMLTPSLALVVGVDDSSYWNRGSYMLLDGVKADFFNEQDTIIAAEVQERTSAQDLGDKSKFDIEAIALKFTAGERCNKQRCDDWFNWDNADKTVNWNKPLSLTP